MPASDPTTPRYDRATIILHWLVAGLLAGQWLGAQVIDWFPGGPLRIDARSVHITGGCLLLLVMILRLGWRATRGRRLPPLRDGWSDRLARAVHRALYLAVFAMLFAGLFATWARGDSLFNLVTVPAFDPTDHALRETVVEIHGTIGSIIIALAALHAGAALVHHYLWRDGLLRRMSLRG